MRNEITIYAAACYNSPTDFDAEIGLRLPEPFKSKQLVIQKGLKTREEALKVAEKFTSILTQNVCDLINDKCQQLKHAQE